MLTQRSTFALLLLSVACSDTNEAAPSETPALGVDAGTAVPSPEPAQPAPDAAAPIDAAPAAPGGESIAVVNQCTLPSSPGPAAISFTQDLVYATPNGQPQALDIIRPKMPGKRPLVVLIHGGGWATGDKNSMRQLGASLTSLGYAAASLNYRLVQEGGANTFPAQVSDVRCAVRWLRANADTYGIDSTRIAALGQSAGAHLSAMLGVGDGVAGLDDGTCPATLAAQPVSVKGAVGYYTPTDFRDGSIWANNNVEGEGVFNMLGGTSDMKPAVAALASPMVHVSAKSAPFFLSHGTEDPRVPIAQSRTFAAALRAAGANATLVEVPSAGHGYPALSDQLPVSSCTMLAFLNKYLAP